MIIRKGNSSDSSWLSSRRLDYFRRGISALRLEDNSKRQSTFNQSAGKSSEMDVLISGDIRFRMSEEKQEMDLSPRTQESKKTPPWIPILVVAAIAGAVIVLVWFLVTNSQSFLPADEAVENRMDIGDKRFQLLGSPISNVGDGQIFVIEGTEYTFFSIAFDDVLVDVVSRGTPPDLFDEGIPVVLEGRWVQGPLPQPEYIFANGANDGWWFSTNRILVKHDNDYREDRIDDAENRGQSPKEPES